jgi:hypothetical protein
MRPILPTRPAARGVPPAPPLARLVVIVSSCLGAAYALAEPPEDPAVDADVWEKVYADPQGLHP